MHLQEFGAINAFGIGAAFTGVVGLGVTAQACRDARAIPASGDRKLVLAAMMFLMSVNLLIAVIGGWVTLLDMQIDGGARG